MRPCVGLQASGAKTLRERSLQIRSSAPPRDQQEAQSEPGDTQALCLCDGLKTKPNPALSLINQPFQDTCITAVKTVKSVVGRRLQT
jgi:hypothetical protein